ncbi:MAG: ribosome biogenesis GTP-binding protein YihA/YsxC [Megasphaera sp.]|nr:ribosome biogenesis GTP-binding protein YihA/YsxC [Megasphaera sp.]MCH4187595.1 ribosome biogenesis GTP-binding protein YihA/YsxC [Megasphaera sp.]MCH4217860.1 ribosome biogenesis GTP-binding protein YihA/YsxC [Megasphaera sp.]
MIQLIRPEYTASAVHMAQYPEGDMPEIAFLGRSNVGKSSLINSLCNYRGLARVSGAPGKTRTINFFSAALQVKEEDREERFPIFLVDLPGYGFAKTGGKNRQSWSDFIGEYVTKSPRLALLCLLVDLRHPGLPIDCQAYEWLAAHGVPLQIIGTKADKLKNNERQKNLAQLNTLFPSVYPAVAYSSLKRSGWPQLLDHMVQCITDQ